jgi:hypothetical protein
MSPRELKATSFSKDTLELFHLINKYQVECLIVGGYAVNFYGHLRLTGDIDIYFSHSDQNSLKLYNVLSEFWGGDIPYLSEAEDLKDPDLVLQYGMPPNRIDLINHIDGVDFADAWHTKEDAIVPFAGESLRIYYLSLDLLIKNKEKLKRPRDIEDLEFLKAAKAKREKP